jgi:hypothetical protein
VGWGWPCLAASYIRGPLLPLGLLAGDLLALIRTVQRWRQPLSPGAHSDRFSLCVRSVNTVWPSQEWGPFLASALQRAGHGFSFFSSVCSIGPYVLGTPEFNLV